MIPTSQRHRHAAPPTKRPRILIVDDEPEIVRALGLRLRSVGYDVLAAADGVQATAMAVREQPDLILLDIGLPGGDGHTIASRIRSNMRTVQIPLIFLTARTAIDDVRKSESVQAAGYVQKPYQPEALLSLVKQALASR
jgi:CheY-like chemotaxis protein